MGTTRYTSGEIIFDPPLQADELRRPELAPFLNGARAVRLVLDEKNVETAEGTLTKRWSDVIAPTHESDSLCSGYVNRDLPDHLAELVDVINSIVHPEHGARCFGRKHIEVCTGAYSVADFEAYQLWVHPSRSGRVPDPPAVHRVDATVTWVDTSPALVPAPRRGAR